VSFELKRKKRVDKENDRHKTCRKQKRLRGREDALPMAMREKLKGREDTFFCENELRRVLCLQADNDPCLACELHFD